MRQTLFITGTDTDAGKTIVSCGLLAHARRAGKTTVAIKPIASGCEPTEQGLRNSDALALQSVMTQKLAYEQVNPVALEPAIAPHIALQQLGRTIHGEQLVGFCRGVMMQRADLTVIEGAGGWRVPLSSREMLSMIPQRLQCSVILVVGMKLGCINHALITAEAILRDGVKLAGWIANSAAPEMQGYAENLQTLKDMLPAPCLGEVPYLDNPTPETVADYLSLPV